MGVEARRVVFGHTHLPVPARGARAAIELVNPGSVGIPLDGDHRAAYALVHDDGRVELRRVEYDWQAAAARGARAGRRAAGQAHRTGPFRRVLMLRSRPGAAVQRPRPARPRVLRPVRGGGRQHPARRRPARADAARLPRAQRARARHPDLRAGRATGSPTTSSSASTRRSSPRSTARTSTRWRRRSTTSSTTPRRSPTTSASTRSRRRWSRRSGWPTCCSTAARQISEAMPRLRGFKDISHYTVEINRLENDGDRITREAIAVAVRQRHRPDGRDPLEGHLRAPRGGDRRDRARGEHPRGHRHQELVAGRGPEWRASSSRSSSSWPRRSPSTSPTASTTPPTWWPPRSPRARWRRGWRSATPRSSTSSAPSSRSRWRRRSPRTSSTPTSITLLIVFGGLVGAIAWNLITWYFGLPSSSSHALIGGIVGAMLVAEGPDADLLRGAAPRQGDAAGAGGADAGVRRRRHRRSWCSTGSSARLRPGPVTGGFRGGQVISGGLLALAHGTNDAQKTMGVIALALVAYGTLPASDPDAADLGGRLGRHGDRARHLRRAAGASSRRWAAASTRWTRRRASPPRARAPR